MTKAKTTTKATSKTAATNAATTDTTTVKPTKTPRTWAKPMGLPEARKRVDLMAACAVQDLLADEFDRYDRTILRDSKGVPFGVPAEVMAMVLTLLDKAVGLPEAVEIHGSRQNAKTADFGGTLWRGEKFDEFAIECSIRYGIEKRMKFVRWYDVKIIKRAF